jgi:membrane protease YdiL (CAAX protease family)
MIRDALPSTIAVPHRVRGVDGALIIAIALLFGAFPIVPGGLKTVVVIGVTALTSIAWLRRCGPATELGVFSTVSLALSWLGVPSSQLPFVLGLAVLVTVVRVVPWFEEALGWMRPGSVRPDVLFLSAASALIAAAGLVAWFLAVRPNVDDLLQTLIPDVSWPLLLVGGVGFAAINAAAEELAYRGVLMQALDAALGAGAVSIVLQAMAFGMLHIDGFPRGWIGVGLAGIYGLFMGALRRKAGGMLAPWIAHVLVDIAIVGILVFLARG